LNVAVVSQKISLKNILTKALYSVETLLENVLEILR